METKLKNLCAPLTWKQLLDSLEGLNPSGEAWIAASTNPDEPDEGRNFVECSGVRSVSAEDGALKVTCYRRGGRPLTWGRLREAVAAHAAGRAGKTAWVRIGYGLKRLADYYGDYAEECRIWGWTRGHDPCGGDYLELDLEVPW